MGGYGFTSRIWGFTLDTIVEAQVVQADGTIATIVDIAAPVDDSKSDLLWVCDFLTGFPNSNY